MDHGRLKALAPGRIAVGKRGAAADVDQTTIR
jgi:hypothetical protein